MGKYLVSNGSLKYEAYSDDENRKYLEGSKVYVRITNGDYSLRKIITGSYMADDIPKNLYTQIGVDTINLGLEKINPFMIIVNALAANQPITAPPITTPALIVQYVVLLQKEPLLG